jgi:(1->4)-alpha-D-glucan 1-alpha-D-glucosylmutase
MYRVPRATYRLQFNPSFTFADARAITTYLAELGISDIYASPILKARKGSPHGYDVVDASALNPDLGSEDDFNAMHAEMEKKELGLLLDVVPNHMAATSENSWWMSVLENGPNSRFLHYFDIDWSPVTTRGETVNKVLLPILGKPYGEALESQEIQLAFDVDGFFFTYFDKRLPLNARSYRLVLHDCVGSLPNEGIGVELRELIEGETTVSNMKFLKETLWRIYEQEENLRTALDAAIVRLNGNKENPESFNDLDELLDRQWYRLAYWRIASEKINYRRFFDVTDLIGVRVENPEVFEARNRRTLELIAEGKVTGLRIDHIDGLYDPIAHMQKLQRRLAGEQNGDNFYIVVEKILARDEELPRDFPVAGTTGYDFLDSVNSVFVNAAGLQQLDAFYRTFSGITRSFAEIAYEKKKQVIHELFSGEMRTLGKQLAALAMADRNARDFAPVDLTSALTEVTASLDVYRTYIRDTSPIPDAERQYIRDAVGHARNRAGTTIDQRIFTFLELVLLVDPPSYLATERDHWLAFVMRWQQFTGRVMAKGVEDTSFYVYNRLLSLNEVGGGPGRSGEFDGLIEFHSRNQRLQRDWPDTMNATSTHDTKRSEDVRARINVISEVPDLWIRQVRKWSKMNGAFRQDGIPHPNEELLVYQTLLGMWPLEEEEMAGVPERLRQYLEKAAREAKSHTSWIAPNTSYEEALFSFASAVLQNAEFCEDFMRFQRRIAFHGFLNALSQLVLKAMAPGVPDFYQGTELWDFSLVDPDNRRPVDYEKRSSLLRRLKNTKINFDTLLRRWQDGRVKLYATWKLLDLRARRPLGTYEPLDAGRNVCAFTRGPDVLVAVPRFTTEIANSMPVGEKWGDRTLPIGGTWTNVFDGQAVAGDRLALSDVFAKFPIAVLEKY